MKHLPTLGIAVAALLLFGCGAVITDYSPVKIASVESWVNLMPGGKPTLHVNAVLKAPLLPGDSLTFPVPTLGSVYQNGREVASFTPQIVLVDSASTDTGKVVSVELVSGSLARFEGLDRSSPFLLRFVVRWGNAWYYPERDGISAEPVY